jgi:predicted TPR repeat methyltransferase
MPPRVSATTQPVAEIDPNARRRADFALGLAERGDMEAAISVFLEALDLAPDWPELLFALADAYEKTGDAAAAIAHFTTCLKLTDDDWLGAGARLAILGAAPAPAQLPDAYIRELFDQYAPRFDSALVEKLGYRGPQQIAAMLEQILPADTVFERVLDLGCGTGLTGEAIRRRAVWLSGIDLSPGMLAEAKRKGVFDELIEAEAVAGLKDLIASGRPLDLIAAGDVVSYFGALEELMGAGFAALKPGGRFIFTTERGEDHDSFRLHAKCRFSHAASYLREQAVKAGFEPEYIAPVSSRMEARAAVPCWLAVFRRPESIDQELLASLPGRLTRMRPGSTD